MTEAKPCLPECRVTRFEPADPFGEYVEHHAPGCPNAAPKASEAPVKTLKICWCAESRMGFPCDCDPNDTCYANTQAGSPAPAPEPGSWATDLNAYFAPAPEPKQERCPGCGHQKHGAVCMNFGSDNECPCKAGEPKQGSACCEECKRYHRHFRTDCCKCRTSFGPSDIPEAEPKQGSKEPQKIRCNLITDPTLKSCEETILALRDDIQTLQGSLAYWRDNRLPAVEAERDALRAEVERLKEAISGSNGEGRAILTVNVIRHWSDESKAALVEKISDYSALRAQLAAADENLKTMLQAAGEEAERQLAAEKARADRAEERVKELKVLLSEDAAGRSIAELLRLSADSLESVGGGPLADSLRIFVYRVESASVLKEGGSR